MKWKLFRNSHKSRSCWSKACSTRMLSRRWGNSTAGASRKQQGASDKDLTPTESKWSHLPEQPAVASFSRCLLFPDLSWGPVRFLARCLVHSRPSTSAISTSTNSNKKEDGFTYHICMWNFFLQFLQFLKNFKNFITLKKPILLYKKKIQHTGIEEVKRWSLYADTRIVLITRVFVWPSPVRFQNNTSPSIPSMFST